MSVDMVSNSQVMLTVIKNPFDPRDLERSNPAIKESAFAIDFIPALYTSVVVSVNGLILEEESYSTFAIKPGDSVVVCPIPQGGGGGKKNILRIVAMIAVAVAAPGLGASLANTMGLGSASVFGMSASAIFGVGISMVGSMLVNALLPASAAMPKAGNFNQGLEESRTYGIDGAKNTSSEDVAVPLVYGRHRMAGNRIAAFVKNAGNTQDLYMLLNAGEGPIAGISEIEINDQPAANYSGFTFQQRIGSATQGPIGWFQDNITTVSRGINLTTDFSTYLTSDEVDKLRIDIAAPSGIAYYNDQGGTEHRSVNLQIQIRKLGDTAWVSMPNINNRTGSVSGYYYTDTEIETTVLRSGTQVVGNAIVDTATNQQVGVLQEISTYSTSHSIGGRGRQTIRRSYESPQLEQARYEVRVRRTSAESTDLKLVNGVAWSDVSEIVTDKVAYRNTALLGLMVRLSDQLNSIPNITFLHMGKLIKVRKIVNGSPVWTFEASSNPAWVAYDIITNKRYGGGVPESRVDINQWQEWADFCEQEGLEFNGVFDTQNNVWDALQYVFRVGHAQIINQGTRYSVAIERADTPVMMFNSSNMVEKSFKLSWLPRAERANEIEITFWDKDNSYKRQMIKVRDPSLKPNDPVRTARVTLFGVTDRERAWKEGIFQLNLNKHILRTVEFDTSIDAIACTVGSQILVQHEIPNWADGGLADPGSTSAILKLDREVEVFAGSSYRVLVSFDALQRTSGTVSGVTHNVAWLNGYDGRSDVKRIIINGIDHEIRRIVNDGYGMWGVELENVTTVLTGHSYAIFDTDVVIERGITNGIGKHSQITVDVPFPQAPALRTKWMFGKVESVKRPFRVLSISGSGEYERSIRAIEYKDEVYDFSTDNVLPVIESTVAISHVRDLNLDNTWVKSGVNYAPVADIGWTLPLNGYYGGADIYMAKNGGDFEKVATVGSQDLQYSYVGLSVGDVAAFKVVAVDIIGQRANASTAPVESFVALARPETGTPTNLAVTTSGGNYILTWSNPTEAFKDIQIYRSIIDDVGTASLINSVTGTGYTDSNAPMGVQVYYWVRTITSDGLTGEWNAANGSTAPIPGQVSNLTLVSPFTGTSASIKWDGISEASDYVVEVYANSLLSRAVTVSGTQYTYAIADAVNDNNVNRSITFTVKPRLLSGVMGAPVSLVATNPQIATPPSNLVLGTTGDHITVNFDAKTDGDLQGYKIWGSKDPLFTPSALNLLQDGRNNGGIFPVEPGETWYVVVAAYDVWGSDGLALSGSQSVEATSSADIAAQLTDTIDRSHLAGVLKGELDALGSQWVAKVEQTSGDGTPYIAGMGLSIEEGESGALSSQFLVKADTFALIPSGTSSIGDTTLPFIVSGGQVFIREAFIEDGSITNAKIGNVIQSNNYGPTSGWRIQKNGTAEFSNIVIRDSEGNIILSSGEGVVGGGGGPVDASEVEGLGAMALIDSITSANISTYIAGAAIQTAQIANGAITNAKIGNVIQSNSYVAGSSGWRIDKNGNMELNAAVFRGAIDVKSAASGARLEIKNDVIKVFDASGTLRVKLGNLNA